MTQSFQPTPRVTLILKEVAELLNYPSADSDNLIRGYCQSLLRNHQSTIEPISPLIHSIINMIRTKSVANRAEDIAKLVAEISQLLHQP